MYTGTQVFQAMRVSKFKLSHFSFTRVRRVILTESIVLTKYEEHKPMFLEDVVKKNQQTHAETPF